MRRKKITEDQLKELIHRAEQLRETDAEQPEGIDEEQLFQIGEELDIPRAFVKKALEERARKEQAAERRRKQKERRAQKSKQKSPSPLSDNKKPYARLLALVAIVAIVAITALALNQKQTVVVEKIVRVEQPVVLSPNIETSTKPTDSPKKPKVKQTIIDPGPTKKPSRKVIDEPMEPSSPPSDEIIEVKPQEDTPAVEEPPQEPAPKPESKEEPIVIEEPPPEARPEPPRPAPNVSLGGDWQLVAYLLKDDGEFFEVPITNTPIDLVEHWNFSGSRYRRVMDSSLSFSGRFTIEAPMRSKMPEAYLGGTSFMMVGHKVRSSIPGIKRPNDYFHGEIKGKDLLLFYLGAKKEKIKAPHQGHLYRRK